MSNLKPLDKEQSLYITAIEESVELTLEMMQLAHTMIKGIRFGLNDVGPSNFQSNRVKISAEANDFIAMLIALNARGVIEINDFAINKKLVKVEQYLQYARNKNALELSDGERFRKLVTSQLDEAALSNMSAEEYLEAYRLRVDAM